MTAYRRDEIISATELAKKLAPTLNEIIENKKEKIAISKNNKLSAVILNIDEYEELKRVYDLVEELEIYKTIKVRENSKVIDFEELLKEDGIDYNDL